MHWIALELYEYKKTYHITAKLGVWTSTISIAQGLID